MSNQISGLNGSVMLCRVLLIVAAVFLAACESPKERAFGYYDKAEAYFDAGDLVKAEIEVKNTLQILPKYPPARYLLANIAEARGDFPEMAQNLRIAVQADNEFVDARVKLGTLYIMGGAVDLAQEQQEYFVANNIDTAAVRILNARIVAAAGDLEAARLELDAALEMEPDNSQALGLLASIAASTDLDSALELIDQGIASSDDDQSLRMLRINLLQQAGRSAEVDASYQQLLKDYPDQVAYGYQYARFLAEEGRIEEVEPVLLGIIDNDPENVQARLALVQFVANTRGQEAGEELLLEFVETSPDMYELRLALGRLYQTTERPDEAYEVYEFLIDAAPNEDAGLTAKARMGGILLGREETEQGAELLEEVLAVDTLNSDALLLRGALKVQQEDYRGAVSDFRSLLRKDPENKQALLLIARAHSAAEDTVLAIEAYQRVLAIYPNDQTVPLELARMLVQNRENDKAEALLRQRLQRAPADIRAARVLIAVLLSQEKDSKALAEAQRIGELEGLEAVGDFLQAAIYQSRGKYKEAVEYFKKSLEVQPTAREPLQGLVASLVQLDKMQEATAYLEKMTKDYPDNLYVKTLLGQVLAGSGDAVAAQEVFESTLDANNNWLPAYTALAGLQGGDVGAQIDIYKRGLAAMPGSQELALLLGTAYERSGRIEDAITAYEDILAETPDLPAVANNLAALLADYRTDRASLERALEWSIQFKDSDNPAFLDTLGWVYYRLGDYKEALPYLKQAVDKAGQVPVLRYHLGMAYLAAGNTVNAKEELEAALADPETDFTGVDEAKAALEKL
jgi:tetratricopeptide (TPR) repeat protein